MGGHQGQRPAWRLGALPCTWLLTAQNPCSDSSDSLIAKINQRLDMMSKEGGRGSGEQRGGEGMQDRGEVIIDPEPFPRVPGAPLCIEGVGTCCVLGGLFLAPSTV